MGGGGVQGDLSLFGSLVLRIALSPSGHWFIFPSPPLHLLPLLTLSSLSLFIPSFAMNYDTANSVENLATLCHYAHDTLIAELNHFLISCSKY